MTPPAGAGGSKTPANRTRTAAKASARAAALIDAAALLVFASVGIAMHGAGFGRGAILRNVVPFLGAWCLLAPVTGVYRRLSLGRLLAHWAVAIPAAVLVRQLWVGRFVSRATVVFLIAALAFTLALLLAGRLILQWRRRTEAGRQDGGP